MLYEGYAIWVSQIKLDIPENTLYSIQNLPNDSIKGLFEESWLILKNAPGSKNCKFLFSPFDSIYSLIVDIICGILENVCFFSIKLFNFKYNQN